MATFVNDTFTDTNGTTLASHTGETGATWAKMNGFTEAEEIQSNQVRPSSDTAAGAMYYASGTPGGADYYVSLDIVTSGTGGIGSLGPMGRLKDHTVSLSADGYYANHSVPAGGWRLFRMDNTTFTQLGSTVSESISGTNNLKLEMIGSAIKLFKKGEGTAAISATDTTYALAGVTGFRITQESSPDRHEFDNFTAVDIASETFVAAPRRINQAVNRASTF